ncbi:MAG: ABC transporter ATP-binding protein [Bdellovibrionota bacterium]
MSSLLKVENLSKNYDKAQSHISVLREVSFDLAPGQSMAVMGESGAGKSTLLQILGAILPPSSGRLFFKEKNVVEMDEKALANFRNQEIGFVFQFHYLLPEFSALENVLIARRIGGKQTSQDVERAKDLLRRVGLEKRMDHRPTELSGGEQQRVAIARALMNRPSLILADEPTGNLDFETSKLVSNLFFSLVRAEKVGLIMATHSNDLASQADQVYRLREGRLLAAQMFSS